MTWQPDCVMVKLIRFFRARAKTIFDRIQNEKLKKGFLQAVPFWIASFVTGVIAVLYARMFARAEELSHLIYRKQAWLLFIVAPACFIAAWWIVKKFAPYARGSGIPQVMAAIELANPRHNYKINKLLSLRILVVKVISSVTMVAGGGVIGREGPTIQIAGTVFRKVNEWLPSWWPKIAKRNMIMTGSAAGLAAAFNTPLGGIVFAVEELTKTHISYFKTALFSAVIIAGLTAQALAGPYLYLGYPSVTELSPWIFLAVIMVAVIAGLSGSIMAKLMLSIFSWKSSFRFNYQHILFLLVCSLAIASCAYFISGQMLGSGKTLMTDALFTSEKHSEWYMPVLRILGPIFSFTSGAAGGVFAPALSAGASIGSTTAHFFHLTEGNSNLLILAGMVAFLTGVTRTPFTSAILVLEMTDRHSLIFHLMLAGMVSSLAALLIDRHSFYDHLKWQYIKEIHHTSDSREPGDQPLQSPPPDRPID